MVKEPRKFTNGSSRVWGPMGRYVCFYISKTSAGAVVAAMKNVNQMETPGDVESQFAFLLL